MYSSDYRNIIDAHLAQMGVLRIDHPDIEEFIEAKCNRDKLTYFNISVAVTDKFMQAVRDNQPFDLVWQGKVYSTVSARMLFDKLMRATWSWAEPGVLFIDRINEMNNLRGIETLAASNPCGEQPLPPYGACLLGSVNLTKINLFQDCGHELFTTVENAVRALDNVIDKTVYPLPMQELEAKAKRRMGIGVTGLANAIERTGQLYGSKGFLDMAESVFATIRNAAYFTSTMLAQEKGAFPLFNAAEYCQSPFIRTLPTFIQDRIRQYGLRNSHLISYAPCGTISLTADNVSSGIEPVFSYQYDRTIIGEDGPEIETVSDYGYREWGVQGRKANDCTVDDHLAVLALATKYSDSAVSKTVNVGDHVTWAEFKDIYFKAWKLNCKGVTTFRAAGERYGILNEKEPEPEGTACYIDPVTGDKSCS